MSAIAAWRRCGGIFFVMVLVTKITKLLQIRHPIIQVRHFPFSSLLLALLLPLLYCFSLLLLLFFFRDLPTLLCLSPL
jgi:hypothetical protein